MPRAQKALPLGGTAEKRLGYRRRPQTKRKFRVPYPLSPEQSGGKGPAIPFAMSLRGGAAVANSVPGTHECVRSCDSPAPQAVPGNGLPESGASPSRKAIDHKVDRDYRDLVVSALPPQAADPDKCRI